MYFSILSALLSFSGILYLVGESHALWPLPNSHLHTGNSLLKLSDWFEIDVNVFSPPQDLLRTASRTILSIQTDKLQRLVVGRGRSDKEGLRTAPTLHRLVLELEQDAPDARPISVEAVQGLDDRDESYSLTVPSDGSRALLTANTTLGLLRGLTTFEQMWYYYRETIYTNMAPLEIFNDFPAYKYRGFMLDTARNFFPICHIKRTLDAMSLVKLNTLHWHITESQSWPLGILEYPEIAEMGAYSENEIYSPRDVQEVVRYAAERGVDVLMEIDGPGHNGIIGESHPEHFACYAQSPKTTSALQAPTGQLRFADPSATKFFADVLGAVAKTLPSTLFSTGGDEVNIPCYEQDEQTQSILKDRGITLERALSEFTEVTQGSLRALGKTPVVWEEMVLHHDVNLSNDTVVMVWVSSEHAASVAAKDFRIIQAPSDYFSKNWCEFTSWSKAYSFNPLANLTLAQQSLVLGGQQLLWTEQSGPQNLDSIVWPRAASSAEAFWTGETLPDGFDRIGNMSEALPRLHELRYRLVQRGIDAIPLQPHWCALRPGACDVDA